MSIRYVSYFLSAALEVGAASTALAGEQVLEFKLVTKPLDLKATEVANVEGETVVSGKIFGVAFFKDGRIAVKDFIHSADLMKGSGPFYGYSTYTPSRMVPPLPRVTSARSKTARARANIPSCREPVSMPTPVAPAGLKASRARSREPAFTTEGSS